MSRLESGGDEAEDVRDREVVLRRGPKILGFRFYRVVLVPSVVLKPGSILKAMLKTEVQYNRRPC